MEICHIIILKCPAYLVLQPLLQFLCGVNNFGFVRKWLVFCTFITFQNVYFIWIILNIGGQFWCCCFLINCVWQTSQFLLPGRMPNVLLLILISLMHPYCDFSGTQQIGTRECIWFFPIFSFSGWARDRLHKFKKGSSPVLFHLWTDREQVTSVSHKKRKQ